MTQALESLETNHKVKLTVPLVASYLARGVKRTQIEGYAISLMQLSTTTATGIMKSLLHS